MATLPNPDQIKRETPTPTMGVAQYRTGIAESAQAQFGADIAKMAEIESVRIDKSLVEQAVTELRQKSFELAAGDDGYAKRQGSQVVHTPQGGKSFIVDYKDRFKTTTDDIASRLTSPRQREEFAQHAAREGLSFQSSLMAHSMKETERFHAQAKEGRINLEMQLGAQNWQNPAKSAESLAEINRVYDNMIIVDGQSADAVNAVRAANVSKFHQAIISEAAANENPEFAKAYLDQHRDQILGVEKIEAEIEKVGNEKLAAQTGVRVFHELHPLGNETGDMPAVAARIREELADKPQEVIDRAIAAAKDEMNMRRDALEQKEAAPSRMVLEGMSIAQIRRTPEFQALDEGRQNNILKAARIEQDRRRGVAERESEATKMAKLNAYYTLVNDPKRLASMSVDQITRAGVESGLGYSMTNSLLSARQSLVSKPAAVEEASIEALDMKYAYASATGSMPKDSDENYLKSRYYVENRIDEKQKDLGRKLTRDEKQAEAAKAFGTIMVDRSWLPGASERRVYEIGQFTEDEIARMVVPLGQREAIIKTLKAQGKTPTEAAIKVYYYEANK